MTLTQTEAMALTLVIEGAVAAGMGRAWGRTAWRCAAAAVLASCITHPILWAVFHNVTQLLGNATTPVLETVIIAAEALAYRAIATTRWDEALLFSFAANFASWFAGELIYVFT
jgi:hypothetical protein